MALLQHSEAFCSSETKEIIWIDVTKKKHIMICNTFKALANFTEYPIFLVNVDYTAKPEKNTRNTQYV
jgi:hypothetical protein